MHVSLIDGRSTWLYRCISAGSRRSATSLMSEDLPSSSRPSPPRALAWGAWFFYFSFLFVSNVPPGPNVFSTGPEFYDAVRDLSLNFFFIYPLIDAAAPVCNPMYEAIFNVAIAHSLLFFGFAADGRHSGVPGGFTPFLAAMPFATNLAYLPYLALRNSNDAPPPRPLTALERFGESRWLGPAVGLIVIFAFSWGIFAREADFGGLSSRVSLLIEVLSTERLAYALSVDVVFFSIFQSWLVPDDLKRREPVTSEERTRLLAAARYVPLFGLCWYLWARPPLRE